jgi:hypothetical protein
LHQQTDKSNVGAVTRPRAKNTRQSKSIVSAELVTRPETNGPGSREMSQMRCSNHVGYEFNMISAFNNLQNACGPRKAL